MFRLDDDAYYEARPMAHTQQGDVHENVPRDLYVAEAATPVGGERKRPGEPGTDAIRFSLERSLAVVCHYTCGFLAQPPCEKNNGKYSHRYRLVAPLIHLRDLKGAGWPTRDLKQLAGEGYLHGVMYVPWPKKDKADEWCGQAAVLVYAMTTVNQSVLDHPNCPRIKRMTADAQRLLSIRSAQVTTPWTFDPNDDSLRGHDISDGWPTSETVQSK
jgi:hypothetical protein